MKNAYRLMSLIFVCVMSLLCFVGCKNQTIIEDTEPSVAFELDGYKIIYGEGNNYAGEAASAIKLQKQIKANYGAELDIGTDYLENGVEYDSDSKEILVGHTAYPQSKSAAERVTALDYLITVDGNKIVLMAGSSDALGECVDYFLDNYIENKDGSLFLSTTDEHLELYEYPHEQTSARIVSLNLRYAHTPSQNNQSIREPRIVSFVQEAQPDSMGVQECEKFWKTRLDSSLNDMGYVAAQEEAYSTSGNYAFKNYIYYNSNTVKLIQGGRIWLSETPTAPSKGFGSKYYISAAWAVLENKETGAKYIHVNTHLNVDSAEIRAKEIEVLLSKINTFEEEGYPVFITGDFNSDMKSDIYKTMTTNYLDARKTAIKTTNLYTYNGYSAEGVVLDKATYKCIDFCFYTEKPYIYANKFNVVDTWSGGYMSDHNALIIDFALYKR